MIIFSIGEAYIPISETLHSGHGYLHSIHLSPACLFQKNRKVKTWCEHHDITAKALYYHMRQLWQKGFALSKRIAGSSSPEKQEVVCLDVSNGISAGALSHPMIDANHTSAVSIDFHGIHIGISNHAAPDTIRNTFRVLQELC